MAAGLSRKAKEIERSGGDKDVVAGLIAEARSCRAGKPTGDSRTVAWREKNRADLRREVRESGN